MIDSARNNPFKTPLNRAQCEESTGDNTSLVPTRTIQAADAAPGDACEFGSLQYFALCGVGGILSCGTTHTFVVPLDLVKCRLQVDQAKYKNLFHGFKISVAEEGARGLAKGWAPTFFGYSAQVSDSRDRRAVEILTLRLINASRYHLPGSLQVRTLRGLQGVLRRPDGRGELVLVPHELVLGCISLR